MVRLRCQLCRRTVFDTKSNELWICPTCEETGVFDVMDISEDEIREMYEGLNFVEVFNGLAKIELPSMIAKSQGVYLHVISDESLEDALLILPLLFDRIFVKDFYFYLSNDKMDIFSDLLRSEIVIPVIDGYEGWTFYEGTQIKPVLLSELMNHTTMSNLITSLAYEDMRAMDDGLLRKLKKRLRKFYTDGVDIDFYGCLGNELKKYNLDLLIASRTGFPFIMEPAAEEIHKWKMKRVSNLFGNEISKELSVVKRFLRNLDISVPVGLTFEGIVSFRKEKASANFRDALFSISKRFQQDSSTDVTQDLLTEFYEKREDFNELCSGYAETRMLLLTGTVSTLGGLLGGPAGAIIGGLGTSLVSPITRSIFRRLYEDNHKDWVYFFWKWHKESSIKMKDVR